MKKTGMNPYLPSWEYVPDGEPHVFEDRLYIYGSHDRAHGVKYCEEDYVGWSAPLSDISNWRYEGVIYKKNQDPDNLEGKKRMYAPDVCQGVDGRYYLYYGLSDVKNIGVAVSDHPNGPFSFYGNIIAAEGVLVKGELFDPAIFVDDDHVYLYYGFSSPKPLFDGHVVSDGAYVVELDLDMKTVIKNAKLIANGYATAKGTCFEEHPFFEASSIRKIGTRYYYLYSSLWGHELCYAVSDFPTGPFTYKGVVISNGDIGISEEPRAYYGNNHGGIVEVNHQHYIFYHRHTHGTHYSRQGCAEKITILQNGIIPQVEMTSCGLNDKPLPANTTIPAYIICNLKGQNGAGRIPSKAPYDDEMPYLRESEETDKRQRTLSLQNLKEGAMCGIKYLNFQGENHIEVTCRGASGYVEVFLDEKKEHKIAELLCEGAKAWMLQKASIHSLEGIYPVYLVFHPTNGTMEWKELRFLREE